MLLGDSGVSGCDGTRLATWTRHHDASGRKERDGSRRLQGPAKNYLENNRDRIGEYEDFAAELGHEPGDVALAWLLHQEGVTAPIVGPRLAEHLESAIRAVDLVLDDKALARLDEIFPGFRTAPEDYAW